MCRGFSVPNGAFSETGREKSSAGKKEESRSNIGFQQGSALIFGFVPFGIYSTCLKNCLKFTFDFYGLLSPLHGASPVRMKVDMSSVCRINDADSDWFFEPSQAGRSA